MPSVQEHISTVDAHINAFEDQVPKKLFEAWHSDLSVIHEEIAKLQVDMTASLAVLMILSNSTPTEPLFDLFTSTEPP